MCVGGCRRLCVCVFACAYMLCEGKVEKERVGGMGSFHEVRGAGRGSCVSLLRKINEDVTKGFFYSLALQEIFMLTGSKFTVC
jgi:hypothetical protein